MTTTTNSPVTWRVEVHVGSLARTEAGADAVEAFIAALDRHQIVKRLAGSTRRVTVLDVTFGCFAELEPSVREATNEALHVAPVEVLLAGEVVR